MFDLELVPVSLSPKVLIPQRILDPVGVCDLFLQLDDYLVQSVNQVVFIPHSLGKLVPTLVHFVVLSGHTLHFFLHFENLFAHHVTIILLPICHFVYRH